MNSTVSQKQSAFLGTRLLSAQLINQLGTGVSTVAIPLLIYGRTHSLLATSLVYLMNGAPALLFGLIGGVHADRMNRQVLVVVSGGLCGAGTLAIPIAYNHFGLGALVIVGAAARACTSFSTPALRAALPALFGDDLQEFLGRRTGVSFLAQAVGPAIGGALVALIGASTTIYVDGASWLMYALLIGSIRGFDPDHEKRAVRAKQTSTFADIAEGLGHLRSNSGATALLIYWFFSLTAVPIALLAAIPYLRTDLGRSAFDYGLASAVYAIGSLVGAWISGGHDFRGGARRWLILAGLGYGAINVLMILQPGFWLFCLLWLAWGLAYGPEEVVGQVAFSAVSPEEFRGRLYSLMSVVMSMASLIGAAVGGLLSVSLTPPQIMCVAGGVFIAATLSCFAAGPGARALAGVQVSRQK